MPEVIGKNHTYFGMDLDYSSQGEVIFSIDSYIIEVIDEFPDEMIKTTKMPAGNHLFKIDDACAKLCERDKIILHRLVVKIIFLIKHARPDI